MVWLKRISRQTLRWLIPGKGLWIQRRSRLSWGSVLSTHLSMKRRKCRHFKGDSYATDYRWAWLCRLEYGAGTCRSGCRLRSHAAQKKPHPRILERSGREADFYRTGRYPGYQHTPRSWRETQDYRDCPSGDGWRTGRASERA